MANLKIGGAVLPHGLMLAPMAGVSDRAFRAVCRSLGAEYECSEMVSAKALVFEQKSRKGLRTAPLAAVYRSECPMAIQLFGSEPAFLAEAARMIEACDYSGCVSDCPPTAIDINMGCPVHKVVSNGEGSALMKDPARAEAIVAAVVKAVKLPVTVKIRAGFDSEHRNAPELAKRLEAAGASLVTVHGRTREQMYAPSSDNGIIRLVKEAVKIPVIGNGDIFSADDAMRMLEETGCDGVMIARGAMGNPWIFSEVAARMDGRAYTAPGARERFDVALSQVARMIEEKGERVAVPEARKHLSWYMKGMNGAAGAREEINRAVTLEDMKNILYSLL